MKSYVVFHAADLTELLPTCLKIACPYFIHSVRSVVAMIGDYEIFVLNGLIPVYAALLLDRFVEETANL